MAYPRHWRCPNCGRMVRNSRYCPFCGYGKKRRSKPKGGKGNKALIVGVAISILIGAFIFWKFGISEGGPLWSSARMITWKVQDIVGLEVIETPGAFGGTYPYIKDHESGEKINVEYHFPFQGSKLNLSLEVNESVYLGAKNGNKEYLYRSKESGWNWKYYQAFIKDPKQDHFYGNLLGKFQGIKSKLGLSKDEYAELLTVFVQSVPYDREKYQAVYSSKMRFPIEVFVEKKGICSEKAMLLAGLLSEEGYNSSLLVFSQENHATAGIACSKTHDYKNTGYCFIESTNYSYIGVPPGHYLGNITLDSKPNVIQVGNGTKEYNRANQTARIEGCKEAAKSNIKKYGKKMNQSGLTMVKYAELEDKYNKNVRLHNYIILRPYDREGVMNYIQKNTTEIC